jgi:RNA processing factor Prp31
MTRRCSFCGQEEIPAGIRYSKALQAKLAPATRAIVATKEVATERIAATRQQVATKIPKKVPFTTARRIRKLEDKIAELQDMYTERERMFRHARHLLAAKALFADCDDSDRLVIHIHREIYDIRIAISGVNHRLALLGDEVKRLSPMAWDVVILFCEKDVHRPDGVY